MTDYERPTRDEMIQLIMSEIDSHASDIASRLLKHWDSLPQDMIFDWCESIERGDETPEPIVERMLAQQERDNYEAYKQSEASGKWCCTRCGRWVDNDRNQCTLCQQVRGQS